MNAGCETRRCEWCREITRTELCGCEPETEILALRNALLTLLDVCKRMELEHDRERPTEEAYLAAIAGAEKALGAGR